MKKPVNATAIIEKLRLKREKIASARDPGKERMPPTPQAPRQVVVLMSGLIMPSWIMLPLYWSLRRAKFRPVLFRYCSVRRDIPENAHCLAEFLRGLKVDEVHVVAYSMGAVILRWASNQHDLPALRRVVLLAPPSRGAFMADYLSRRLGPFFPIIYGRGSLQLRQGHRGICERAGAFPATTETGVIAGGTGKGTGFNKLIPGDNDMTVGVAETLLPGMTDFALVRSIHSGLPVLRRSRSLVVRFLQNGQFRGKG